MKLDGLWADLDGLLVRLGLSPVTFTLSNDEKPWAPIFTETSLEDIPIPPPGEPYRVDGRTFFIYIRDTWLKHIHINDAIKNPQDYTRIHLTECSTIRDMRKSNRFERFVRTDKKSGGLPVNLKSKSGEQLHAELELRVCKHCLQQMNWHGYTEPGIPRRAKSYIWESFRREDFLERYSPRFHGLPSGRDTDPPDDYTADWTEVSRAARKGNGFKCEVCLVRAPPTEARLLDVHHRDHRKRNNAPGNLQVLCKLCHAERHEHYKVSVQDRERLRSLRRDQGLPDR